MERKSVYQAEDNNTAFTLSSLQQAYLFGADKAFDLHVATHTYFEFRLPNLDLPQLQHALNHLITLHDALRLVVTSDGFMRVLSQVPVYKIKIVDLSNKDELCQQQHLCAVRQEFERADSDFTQWPGFAMQVTRMPDGFDHAHINISPMFLDGRSVSRLFHELSIFYQNPSLALETRATSFSYAQYARHRENIKSSEAYQKARAYWWKRLHTLPPGPELPWRQARRQPMRSQLNRRRLTIDTDTWQALKKHASDHRLGLTALMLTLYAATLAHWSKNKHFTITMLVQNRERDYPGVDEAAASFASTVQVELDFRQPQSLIKHVKAVQKQLFLDLMNTRMCGLELMQERNREQHNLARAGSLVAFVSNLEAIIDTSWSQDYFHRNGRYLLHSNLETPQIGLDHQLGETQAGELALNWDAMDTLFQEGIIDNMLETYHGLINTFAQSSDWEQTLSIDLPSDQAKLINQANRTQSRLKKCLLHELFLQQVPERESLPVIINTDSTLNYLQLQQRATFIASALNKAATRPNEVIAIFMHKGWEQVVAAMGITWSGAAYLPIDPGLPVQRINYLLQRCDIKLVITQHAYAEHTALQGLECIVVTEQDSATSTKPAIKPEPCAANDQDLAYIIFTSGSTGLPKGVMLNHEGPVNTILDINRKFGINAQDRVFAISALSFDLSVYDLFGILAAGGAIIMPDHDRIRDPGHWLDLMEAHRVTVWNSAPALMQMLVEYCNDTHRTLPSSLRVVMLSGDWIPTWLPTAIQTMLPQVKIHSLGGATEASIWSIYYTINSVDPQWLSIPYGKPLANQSMHVLDEQLNPRPVGVPGDLYIGGIGLAKGYWKDQTMTENAFIRHPISDERLYRTGDLGRYLNDGNIEFLGREDSQIKLQGYRVELGEIESVLQQLNDVTHCVVVVHGDKTANRRLVAYVAKGKSPLTVETVTAHATNHLPPYMVPANIILLEQLPVTTNGKVDRDNLPSPEPINHKQTLSRCAHTDTERKLLSIWQKILNLTDETIDVNTSFFDLGGQSFLSVRLMARIQQQFNVVLPLAILIESDTIATLAERIETDSNETQRTQSPLVQLRAGDKPSPIFLVHPVGGNVLCYRGLVNQLQELNCPFYGLQSVSHEVTGQAAQTQDLETIAARYVKAITELPHNGSYSLGGWSMGGVIAAEMARQLISAEKSVNHLFMLDSPAPLDHRMPDEAECIQWFFHDFQGSDSIWLQDYAQQNPLHWAAVLEHAINEKLLPAGTSNNELDALYTLFTTNLHALRNYHARPVKDVKNVWVARAQQQPIKELQYHAAAEDPAWGWRDYIQGPMHVSTIAGDHYSILAEENLPGLSAQFLEWYTR